MSNGTVQEADELNTEGTTEAEAEGIGESVEEVGETGASQEEQAAEQNAHASVSYVVAQATTPPAPTPTTAGGAGDEGGEAGAEAGEEESSFESVEGWEKGVLQEAAYDEAAVESTIDAYYAEAEEQEFFQILAPLVPTLVKAVVPALASAVGQQLSPRIRQLLLAVGRRRKERGGAEASDEAFFDEAGVLQQLEQLEVIIGTDDRIQIMRTNQLPWSRICHLAIEAQNGRRFLGSGAFIGRNTILTAGHCVYMHNQGGWARSITVSPGRNANSRPFGQVRATQFRSVRGWVNGTSSTRRDYDYAAIIIAPNSGITGQVGAFGFAAYTDQYLAGKRLNLAGYPGDKAAGTMWYHGRRATCTAPR